MTREELLRFDGSCNKNELRRKGLCFICKGPWGPKHSCMGDTEETTGGDQEEIPSNFQDEGSSSIVESMDTYEEHEQLGGVVDNNLEMQPCLVEEIDG